MGLQVMTGLGWVMAKTSDSVLSTEEDLDKPEGTRNGTK